MPILFVPFATVGSRPRNIRTGREIKEPPPAITFIIPTKNPTSETINNFILYLLIDRTHPL